MDSPSGGEGGRVTQAGARCASGRKRPPPPPRRYGQLVCLGPDDQFSYPPRSRTGNLPTASLRHGGNRRPFPLRAIGSACRITTMPTGPSPGRARAEPRQPAISPVTRGTPSTKVLCRTAWCTDLASSLDQVPRRETSGWTTTPFWEPRKPRKPPPGQPPAPFRSKIQGDDVHVSFESSGSLSYQLFRSTDGMHSFVAVGEMEGGPRRPENLC